MPFPLLPVALAGGAGLLGGLFGGRSSSLKPERVSSFDPTQKKLYEQYANALMGGGGPLADIFNYDPEQLKQLYTQQFAEPAYQQFQEEIIPGITGQFRGQNLENSSYAAGAVGKAGENVQSNLNAQLANMLYNAQQQSLQRKQAGLGNLLGMQTFAYNDSPLMQLLNQLSGSAGKAVGSWATGKLG